MHDPNDAPVPDAALIERARGGDSGAAAELLKRVGGAVRRGLTGTIGPHHRGVLDEDDVMQVTYLEAFARLASFAPRGDPAASFQAWLAQIARNNLRDAIRGLERAKRPDPRRRVQPAPNQDSYASLVEVLGVTTTTPSRVAAKNEAAGAIDAALARMPEDYAKAVRLYDLMGRSVEEVAHELGRSPGAVFMLRARAHDRLRELMGTPSRFFSRGT